MSHFTPLSALLGGLLIGAATALLLFTIGRVAGVSGIVGGLFTERSVELGWRLTFLFGLLAGGLALRFFAPGTFELAHPRSYAVLAVAGLLVGYGARLGGGCTSGHGVCGLSRLSARSLVATLTFMSTGALTVLLLGRAS